MNELAVIVAVAKNGVIGKNNQLPWRLRADLQWFKQCTMGHTIVMGRKTFESIGKPLPGRENLVLTRQRHFDVAGCRTCTSLENALTSSSNEKVFVIGGAEIYRQAMPRATWLYLTIVKAEVDGDTWFPFVDLQDFDLTESQPVMADEHNQYDCEFRIYRRKDPLKLY